MSTEHKNLETTDQGGKQNQAVTEVEPDAAARGKTQQSSPEQGKETGKVHEFTLLAFAQHALEKGNQNHGQCDKETGIGRGSVFYPQRFKCQDCIQQYTKNQPVNDFTTRDITQAYARAEEHKGNGQRKAQHQKQRHSDTRMDNQLHQGITCPPGEGNSE
ncbi:hypothetical protein XSR1_190026 [Xenorhabdus szentirmaii DSM 16338]|uniref:Uncharacterized protein n=1 Tax=Xenorhabdus szentirmaii DSM 16338 TaxID=1427518 RepID=W1IWU5_9GAMM|nr:hypothetical protein XSR1_190026 [Xenorhabdus szentirmaii DSM 16338]